ncbi:MAG: hypothetical protein Q9204_007211, partial [Flavoplaca sp. TL-2023a]
MTSSIVHVFIKSNIKISSAAFRIKESEDDDVHIDAGHDNCNAFNILVSLRLVLKE